MESFSKKRAFIVRPFAPRGGIDFKEVEKQLIAPALAQLDIQGGTTELFLEAGSIRVDMFQQLLVADIVIADVSVHNANVFYELGIRHALRPKHTYLLRAKIDKPYGERTPEDYIPFDILTDRYLEYDPKDPAAKLPSLLDGLQATLSQEKAADSPVFLMLPGLESQDHSRFLAVPQSFRAEVELAAQSPGRLGLLAMEAEGFPWELEGLRVVGRAQFELKAGAEAKRIWEELLKLNPFDVEANHKLAMINRRLANALPREASDDTGSDRGAAGGLRKIGSQQTQEAYLTVPELEINEIHRMQRVDTPSSPPQQASQAAGEKPQAVPTLNRRELLSVANLALHRVVNNRAASATDRAEALSLLASNILDRWVSDCSGPEGTLAQTKALKSLFRKEAYEKFRQAFYEDLNSFSPGLNALALLILTIELAKKQPRDWELFSDSENPQTELGVLEQQRRELEGAVKNSLEAARQRLERNGRRDWRVDIGTVDFQFLTQKTSGNLERSYERALSDAAELPARDARERLELFQKLDVFRASAEMALQAFPAVAPPITSLGRVILFTGQTPKHFPNSDQAKALKEILKQVVDECKRTTDGEVIGVASGAIGGDIIFHEVCHELHLKHHLYLPVPHQRFWNKFVSLGGEEWRTRFNTLLNRCPSPPHLADSADLPVWLTTKKDYSVRQRANLWMIYEALALGAKSWTLLALLDGATTLGSGDTHDMMTVADRYGGTVITICTTNLQ